MDVFPHKEPPKYFLNHDGLLGKVGQVLLIGVLHFSNFKLTFGMEHSKGSLNSNGGSLLPQEFFALGKHAELGLYFKSSGIVSLPVLFGLVG